MDRRRKKKIIFPPKERSGIIAGEAKGINSELFREYFKYESPSYLYENLNNTKSTEKKVQIDLIKKRIN